MRRLQAVLAGLDDEELLPGFVMPNGIGEWRRYLAQINPTDNPDYRMHRRVRWNLGHRFQLLEFECAMLLQDCETKIQSRGRSSTLHETISRFKIQQYCVLAHSILECLGSHFFRATLAHRGQQVDETRKVGTNIWRPALAGEVLKRPTHPDQTKGQLIAALTSITTIRDRVHLDTIDPNYDLDFNHINYEESFLPTYRTFQIVLTALNPNWPDCCMNEDK